MRLSMTNDIERCVSPCLMILKDEAVQVVNTECFGSSSLSSHVMTLTLDEHSRTMLPKLLVCWVAMRHYSIGAVYQPHL